MPLDPDQLRIIAAYQEQVDQVAAATVERTRSSYEALPDYNRDTFERWTTMLLGLITGAQILTAALTDRYLAAIGGAIAGGIIRPVGVPRDVFDIEAMRGVPAAEVYHRPAVTVWHHLGDGSLRESAVAAGLVRALELVTTDLQLTKTHTARYVGGRSELVVGYRRVVSGAPCSLCTSRTGRFSKHELMPIHGWCRCSMVPVYKGRPDPGPVKVAPADDRGASSVHEHGEVGPMLTARGDAFGPPP